MQLSLSISTGAVSCFDG